MTIPWQVDPETSWESWAWARDLVLGLVDRGTVVDLGGAGGSFVSPLREKGIRLVTVDVVHDVLRRANPGVAAVEGSLLALPFRDDAMDAIAARAVLHHVPDNLDGALTEARRIVRPGGRAIFLEPLAGNPIAAVARWWFPTDHHEPGERPLSWDGYVDAVRRHFEVEEATPRFLISYLLPHLAGRVREDRRGLARTIVRWFLRLDARLLRALPRLRPRAAYIAILARRPDA